MFESTKAKEHLKTLGISFLSTLFLSVLASRFDIPKDPLFLGFFIGLIYSCLLANLNKKNNKE